MAIISKMNGSKKQAEDRKKKKMNSNSVDEEKSKKDVGVAGVFKFDFDFGCWRFRGVKVKPGKNLVLNIIDDVNSVALDKRSADICSIKKHLCNGTNGKCCCCAAAVAATHVPATPVPAAAADTENFGRETYLYVAADGRLYNLPISRGWKGLDCENTFNDENTSGCTIM